MNAYVDAPLLVKAFVLQISPGMFRQALRAVPDSPPGLDTEAGFEG